MATQAHYIEWNQPINAALLHIELAAALGQAFQGLTFDGRRIGAVIEGEATPEMLQAALAVLHAHNPDERTPEQQQREVAQDAPERARAIPGWATWDEAQAVAYIENNVKDLASAKIVLVAMARLLVALRDAQWPGLDIEG